MIIFIFAVLVTFISVFQQRKAINKVADSFANGNLPLRGKNVIFRA